MKALILVEHNNQKLNDATYSMITAALSFSSEIEVLIAGYQCEAVVSSLLECEGVKKILYIDSPEYVHQFPEDVAPLLARYAEGYDYVIAAATVFGKNILPRAAALCDAVMVSDVVKIVNENTFVRPMYAGNVQETLMLDEKVKFLTIRSSAFPKKVLKSAHRTVVEQIADPVSHLHQVEFLGQALTEMTRPDLQGAKVVVSGGRGLQSKENFELVYALADALGAAVGASRAAVDAAYVSNDCQVGQTGKIVAPDLYFALGISGAIQHLAGMKDSKVVVAINKDPEAPIFKAADYGMVGDLFEIVPALTKALKQGE